MKAQLSIALFVFFLCVPGTSVLRAQDGSSIPGQFYAGISGGAPYNYYPGIAEGRIPDLTCPKEDVVIWQPGYSIGLVAEYRLGPVFSLVSHALFSTHPGKGSETVVGGALLPDPDPNKPPVLRRQVVRVDVEAQYDLLSVDLLGKARLVPVGKGGAGVAFGLAFGYAVSLDQTWLHRLIEPEDERFIYNDRYPMREDGRVLVIAENESVEDISTIRLSLRSGLFYDLKLSDRFHITPGAYFDYGLTPAVSKSEWKLNCAMLQLDVTARL